MYDYTRSLEEAWVFEKKHLLRYVVWSFISTPSGVWNTIFPLAWPWRDRHIF